MVALQTGLSDLDTMEKIVGSFVDSKIPIRLKDKFQKTGMTGNVV